jgi:hypothetical protein
MKTLILALMLSTAGISVVLAAPAAAAKVTMQDDLQEAEPDSKWLCGEVKCI